MLRIQYGRYGGPEELRLDDVGLVQPKGPQVRVQVMAASVNPMKGPSTHDAAAWRRRLSPARPVPVMVLTARTCAKRQPALPIGLV